MSDKNTTAKRAPQVASGNGPRPGLRPGTRAWARAQPTADDPAAALPEAEPDHHLQEAGGDVAGAEGVTVDDSAANAQPLSDHGDDADAQASQTRSARRLADWLADARLRVAPVRPQGGRSGAAVPAGSQDRPDGLWYYVITLALGRQSMPGVHLGRILGEDLPL